MKSKFTKIYRILTTVFIAQKTLNKYYAFLPNISIIGIYLHIITLSLFFPKH